MKTIAILLSVGAFCGILAVCAAPVLAYIAPQAAVAALIGGMAAIGACGAAVVSI